MADSAENTKLDIEQLADFLAGRASPDVAGRLRRELADPLAEASELLMAFDEADGDPLNVDWSRLDEPSRNIVAKERTSTVAKSRSSLRRWMHTIGVGLAAGLASVAFLFAIDGKLSALLREGQSGEAQVVARPPRAIKLEAELATAESLSPPLQDFDSSVKVVAIAESLVEPAATLPQDLSVGEVQLPVVEVQLVGESRPTGLQMREHLAVFGIGSP